VRIAVRFLACAIVAGGALAGAGSAGASAPQARTEAVQPTHLLVYAQEWSLWPSRGSVPAGTISVELWNRGQDAHDLRVRKLNSAGQMVGPTLGAISNTLPGQVHNATWKLRSPGHYELYCSLPGHAALGMVAKLTVKPDRA
jgi:uncharacterized cupredoxin-like copper-binding protein